MKLDREIGPGLIQDTEVRHDDFRLLRPARSKQGLTVQLVLKPHLSLNGQRRGRLVGDRVQIVLVQSAAGARLEEDTDRMASREPLRIQDALEPGSGMLLKQTDPLLCQGGRFQRFRPNADLRPREGDAKDQIRQDGQYGSKRDKITPFEFYGR